MTDLMAWNADATRMPYRMHSEYLRRLFLDNDLAEGRLTADGTAGRRSPTFGSRSLPSAPSAIMSRRGTRPTRSICRSETDVTYLLTTGGHNAGIVSEPGHRGRSFRINARREGDQYLDPARFLAEARRSEGSWWPELVAWLNGHSGPRTLPPPARRFPAAGRRTRHLRVSAIIREGFGQFRSVPAPRTMRPASECCRAS